MGKSSCAILPRINLKRVQGFDESQSKLHAIRGGKLIKETLHQNILFLPISLLLEVPTVSRHPAKLCEASRKVIEKRFERGRQPLR